MQSQLGLHNKFQTSQGYRVRPCFKEKQPGSSQLCLMHQGSMNGHELKKSKDIEMRVGNHRLT